MVAARFTLLRQIQDKALSIVVRYRGGPLNLDFIVAARTTRRGGIRGRGKRCVSQAGDKQGISFSPVNPVIC